MATRKALKRQNWETHHAAAAALAAPAPGGGCASVMESLARPAGENEHKEQDMAQLRSSVSHIPSAIKENGLLQRATALQSGFLAFPVPMGDRMTPCSNLFSFVFYRRCA